jgi:hypothetical protein
VEIHRLKNEVTILTDCHPKANKKSDEIYLFLRLSISDNRDCTSCKSMANRSGLAPYHLSFRLAPFVANRQLSDNIFVRLKLSLSGSSFALFDKAIITLSF